ncbi:MAG: hypothetical protein RLZZ70_476 [Candidatus Parcubacteria bacterium]|jgi:hypothetical protein
MKWLTYIAIGVVSLLYSVTAEAATINLSSQTDRIQVGDTLVVTVTLSSLESVNAMEGIVDYPADQLRLLQADDANSAITLWVRRPMVRDLGQVSFMGITPGGFSGEVLPVVRLQFAVIATGSISLSTRETRVLRHDGVGSHVSVTEGVLSLDSQNATTPTVPQALLTPEIDTEPPLAFAPVLVNDEEAYDGLLTLVFDTSDQGSGIAEYQVKEYRYPWLAMFANWQVAYGTYTLKHQDQSSYVVVKAVDYSGNERVSVWHPIKPTAVTWWWIIGLGLLCGLLLWFCIRRYRQSNPDHHNNLYVKSPSFYCSLSWCHKT